MRVKKPAVVRASHHVDLKSLRERFMNGITSTLRRVSPARWKFAGGVLLNPELVGSR